MRAVHKETPLQKDRAICKANFYWYIRAFYAKIHTKHYSSDFFSFFYTVRSCIGIISDRNFNEISMLLLSTDNSSEVLEIASGYGKLLTGFNFTMPPAKTTKGGT